MQTIQVVPEKIKWKWIRFNIWFENHFICISTALEFQPFIPLVLMISFFFFLKVFRKLLVCIFCIFTDDQLVFFKERKWKVSSNFYFQYMIARDTKKNINQKCACVCESVVHNSWSLWVTRTCVNFGAHVVQMLSANLGLDFGLRKVIFLWENLCASVVHAENTSTVTFEKTFHVYFRNHCRPCLLFQKTTPKYFRKVKCHQRSSS